MRDIPNCLEIKCCTRIVNIFFKILSKFEFVTILSLRDRHRIVLYMKYLKYEFRQKKLPTKLNWWAALFCCIINFLLESYKGFVLIPARSSIAFYKKCDTG